MAHEKSAAGFSLKDHLFNPQRVRYLAGLFQAADGRFDASRFVRETVKALPKLALKERIVHIAGALENHLESDYRSAATQIMAALPPPLDPTKTDNDFGDFIFAPLGEFVVRNGLAKRDLRLSLKTLKAITQRFSMEDAIRTFINTYPDETLDELRKWSTDANYHVRRLVSEGTRPTLPWSKRLTIDVATPLPLLDQLHADPTRYVTRSVANHLNDIAKSQPALVLGALKRWKQQRNQESSELRWMSKHALRTLVKQGDSQALQFLGFHAKPKIQVTEFALKSSKIKPGQAIEFAFKVTAQRDESLLIDFVIDFVKANGKLSPKVHKLKEIKLGKGESATLNKRHLLRAAATTYTLYPGRHHLTLQINGKPFGTLSFVLT
jgi:3-methyladenine DNA glycosylase AlkC